jgi:hypothetical protein
MNLFSNSRSQTFNEDWWTMLIEPGTKWTLNQSYEFKVMNSLNTPRPKTKDEYYWYFVPYINIKEDEDTYAFNKILIQHGAKLKWGTRWMGWCWFLSLKVYEMTPVFFHLVLNHFNVEWKLFSKVCDPLMYVTHYWKALNHEPLWLLHGCTWLCRKYWSDLAYPLLCTRPTPNPSCIWLLN